MKIGTKVEVTGKDVVGTVAYIGSTQFSAGKWIGVILNEPKGKNNGTVQGKRYFTCDENFGIFVRPSQIVPLDNASDSSIMESSTTSELSVASESGLTKASWKSGSTSQLSPKSTQQEQGKRSSLKPPRQESSTSKRDRSPGLSAASKQSAKNVASSEKINLQLSPRGSTGDISKTTPKAPDSDQSKSINPKTRLSLVENIADQAKPASKVPEDVAQVKKVESTHSKPVTSSVQPEIAVSSPKFENFAPPNPTSLSPPSTSSKEPPVKTLPSTVHTTPASSVAMMSKSVIQSSSDNDIELANLQAANRSLADQVETLKTKREEDRVRLQDLERLKIQISQLEENRRLMREQAADLQREVAQVKTEKSEVKEAFDRYRDEVAEMIENVEMATLDKEMAEEKLDTLIGEMELLKEQIEELTLENQILKEESKEKGEAMGVVVAGGDGGDSGSPTIQEFKNLEQQNERMKQALVKMRDLANQDKQQIATLNKQLSAFSVEASQLQTEKERLQSELKTGLDQIIELKEQVDASLGADQIISQLTQRNLQLEELVEKVKEEHKDLEILCEMNDELQENSREVELELRNDLERANSQINQLVKHLEASRETSADYEQTLVKFRELVANLQTQNAELRRLLADGKRQHEQQNLDQQEYEIQHNKAMMDQQSTLLMGSSMVLASNAQTLAKVIEAELRRLESEQCLLHVNRLSSFLPDSFLRRGGDNDSLLALLFIDRMSGKCDLLANHLSERYPLPTCIPGQVPMQPVQLLNAPNVSDNTVQSQVEAQSNTAAEAAEGQLLPLAKSKVEFYSFITRLVHLLRCICSLLLQFKQVLSRCGVELYMKFGSLYQEMGQYEQCIDRLLDLTKNNQLDENISLESLTNTLSYFGQLYAVHLVDQPIVDCTAKLTDFTRTMMAALDALSVDSTVLMILTGQDLDALHQSAKESAACVSGVLNTNVPDRRKSSTESTTGAPATGDLVSLITEVIRFTAESRVITRRVRRRIPTKSDQPLSFNADVNGKLDKIIQLVGFVVTIMSSTTRLAGRLAIRNVEDSVNLNPSQVFAECLTEVSRQTLASNTAVERASAISPDLSIRAYLTEVSQLLGQITTAMENGEYDFDGTKQVGPKEPVRVRAIAYKNAQAELEGCRVKLESKSEEMNELQRTLKASRDELSEMSVRVSLAEKKLETSGKGNEEKISRLEQSLEEAESQLKRTEKEYEQTLDALQADIYALEQEKSDLKDKLKALSKKALFEGLISSPLTAASPAAKKSSTSKDLATSEATSPHYTNQTRLSVFRDTSLMANEIGVLRETVRHLAAENSKLCGTNILQKMSALKPLPRAYKYSKLSNNEESHDIDVDKTPDSCQHSKLSQVRHQASVLHKQVLNVLAHPKVVRLPKLSVANKENDPNSDLASKPYQSAAYQLVKQATYLVTLKSEFEKLKDQTLDAMNSEVPNAFIQTDFASFPSAQIQHALVANTEPTEMDVLKGRLIFPHTCKSGPNVQKLFMNKLEMREFHRRLFAV